MRSKVRKQSNNRTIERIFNVLRLGYSVIMRGAFDEIISKVILIILGDKKY